MQTLILLASVYLIFGAIAAWVYFYAASYVIGKSWGFVVGLIYSLLAVLVPVNLTQFFRSPFLVEAADGKEAR